MLRLTLRLKLPVVLNHQLVLRKTRNGENKTLQRFDIHVYSDDVRDAVRSDIKCQHAEVAIGEQKIHGFASCPVEISLDGEGLKPIAIFDCFPPSGIGYQRVFPALVAKIDDETDDPVDVCYRVRTRMDYHETHYQLQWADDFNSVAKRSKIINVIGSHAVGILNDAIQRRSRTLEYKFESSNVGKSRAFSMTSSCTTVTSTDSDPALEMTTSADSFCLSDPSSLNASSLDPSPTEIEVVDTPQNDILVEGLLAMAMMENPSFAESEKPCTGRSGDKLPQIEEGAMGDLEDALEDDWCYASHQDNEVSITESSVDTTGPFMGLKRQEVVRVKVRGQMGSVCETIQDVLAATSHAEQPDYRDGVDIIESTFEEVGIGLTFSESHYDSPGN